MAVSLVMRRPFELTAVGCVSSSVGLGSWPSHVTRGQASTWRPSSVIQTSTVKQREQTGVGSYGCLGVTSFEVVSAGL